MDRRLITVLTDLDLAGYYLRKGDYERALDAASVALINAIAEHEEACTHKADNCDDWEEAVNRAFAVKSLVLRSRP